MTNVNLSPEAQEAMRGDFVLAGEAGQPSATAEDLGAASAVAVQHGLSADLVEAAREHLSVRMSLEDQFEFNGRFLEAMGLQMPGSTAFLPRQSNKLEQSYNQTANNAADELTRLVVAPLFPSDSNLLQNRQNMLRNIRDNFSTPLSAAEEPLDAPSDRWIYGRLLQNPNSRQELETMLYYRSPRQKLVDRMTYLFQVCDQNLAVLGRKSILWTYNFVDINPAIARRPDKTVKQLFGQVPPTNTPEQELVVQALHLIAGIPNPNTDENVTNEAVYALDKRNKPKTLRNAAGVSWRPNSKRVQLFDVYADERYGSLGIRPSVGGL